MAEENRITDIPGDTTHQGTGDADTFVFGPGYANDDTITGFTVGQDRIDLTRFAGITRFEDLSIVSDDGGVTIDLTDHGGGTIRLTGSDIAVLDSTDFVFSTLDGGGTTGDDVLWADDGGDRLDGGSGDDVLTGGDGDDILLGGAGDDYIQGGEGDDALVGGGELYGAGATTKCLAAAKGATSMAARATTKCMAAQGATRSMAGRTTIGLRAGRATTRSAADGAMTRSCSPPVTTMTRSPTSPTGKTPLI